MAKLHPRVLDGGARPGIEEGPAGGYDGDWDALESLLERLCSRRRRVPELLRESKRAARDPFPGWTLKAATVAR